MKKRRSKIHPNQKSPNRVANWAEYDRSLRQRGDITIWFTPAAIGAWKTLSAGLRGGQLRYSDVAIEVALALRMAFGLAWRQTEGLLSSLVSLMCLELDVPDHTTLARRTSGLEVALAKGRRKGPLHLIVDATGLGMYGEGEWAEGKWGGRGKRGRRKLHIAVDETGFIVAAELADNTVADASAFPVLLGQVSPPVARVTADGAYDRRAVFDVIETLGATSVLPPARTAVISGEGSFSDRDRHLEHIRRVGRLRWRLDVGQHEQSLAENTFYRYKTAFGSRLKSRTRVAQRNEIVTGCNILNRFAALGMPQSLKIEV